ncbi:MAG: ABC transporter ATP-binding protein, partial [Candidatus Bathyarchaeia archaeon]
SPGHFAYTTVYRNLAYHAKIQQIDNIEERVTEILKQFELWDKKDKSVNTLSKGMMQKLAIARSLLHDPDILFFDEPTSGLDPNTQMNIRNLVKELAKSGKTVLLSSHNLTEVQEICSHIAVINKGKIVVCDELRKLVEGIQDKAVMYITFSREIADDEKSLRNICRDIGDLNFVKECEVEDRMLRVALADYSLSPKLNQFMVEKNLPIVELKKKTQSIEDLYVSLVREK